MNTTTFTGRLTKNPDIKRVGADTICELRVAVDSPEDHPTFVSVVTWNTLAMTVMRYVAKGRRVGVTGRLSHDEWTTDIGEHRSRLYVTARSVDFLDRPAEAGNVDAGAGEQ